MIRLIIEDAIPDGAEGSDTQKQLIALFGSVLQLQERKAQMYGEAWRSQGYMGNVARVLSKASRIKNMLWQDQQVNDDSEPIHDTIMDLICLSAFAYINFRDGNKWGN